MSVLKELEQELAQLKVLGREVTLTPIDTRSPGFLDVQGVQYLDFSCWDCLNLRQMSQTRRTLTRTISQLDVAMGGSRTMAGSTTEHQDAERRLAQFLGQQKAMYMDSRNQALMTLITSIAGSHDVVLAERGISDTLADVAYIAEVDFEVFSIADTEFLRRLMEKYSYKRRILVFVESVSRMTGEALDLSAVSKVCAAFQALLCVEESSALALSGTRGAGSLDVGQLQQSPFCQYGDLGLGLAAYGGFVAGPKTLIEYLHNRSNSFRSTPAPPPVLLSLLKSQIDVSETMVVERNQLREKALSTKMLFEESGLSVVSGQDLPLLTMSFRAFSIAREFVRGLRAQGIYANAYGPKDVRSDYGYVQFLINRSHTVEHLKKLTTACDQITSRMEHST